MARITAYETRDIHGAQTLPDARGTLSIRGKRDVKHNRIHLVHAIKNGIHDPVTHWHILDALMDVKPDQQFRAIDLVRFLKETRPQLIWDARTVGRILADQAESLAVNRSAPLQRATHHDGVNYWTSPIPENRAIMEALLEDLAVLSEKMLAEEQAGRFPKRDRTPTMDCPSVMDIAAS